MKCLYALLLLLGCALLTPATAAPTAKWTVLVYMNGHNNLENEIPVNFRQMSAVGSTAQVNIVAQVARLGAGAAGQPWRDHVYRYRVTQNMALTPATATMTLPQVDMGNPATLRSFLAWGAANYPAEHYMLVMWGHGQGYRMQMLTAGLQHRLSVLRGMTLQATPGELNNFMAAHPEVLADSAAGIPSNSPYRTVSSDDVFNSKLYMSDLQASLQDVITHEPNFHGAKLALLGFDACLMAMVENAYAFRDVAQYMVASQDLDPGAGWSYRPWLTTLVQNPSTDPASIGKSIVDSFADAYQNTDGTTTMSETDLSKADALAQATSQLADKMISALPGALRDISAARARCPYYAPDPFSDGHDYFYHIDLGCFVEGLANSAQDPAVKAAAVQTNQALKVAVLRSYAGSDRVAFGSKGLCIYFPATHSEFNGDLYAENGYIKTNLNHPVEFVRSLKWADFLAAYYGSADAAARTQPSAARAQRL